MRQTRHRRAANGIFNQESDDWDELNFNVGIPGTAAQCNFQRQQLMKAMMHIAVLFGSQTGNAEQLAQRTAGAVYRATGVECTALSLNDWWSSSSCGGADSSVAAALAQIDVLLVVMSTTGNGEFPDNASKGWRKIRRSKIGQLPNLKYSVLGLGDSNYDRFCNSSKEFEELIRKSGANNFYPCAFADDGVGLDMVVEPYLQGLEVALRELAENRKTSESDLLSLDAGHQRVDDLAAPKSKPKLKLRISAKKMDEVPKCRIEISFSESKDEVNVDESSGPWRWKPTDTEAVLRGLTPEAPFWSQIVAARYLTSPDSEKIVVHIELELPRGGNGMSYWPGDAVGIYCPNESCTVAQLIARLGWNGDQIISIFPPLAHVPPTCKLSTALLYCCDINAVTKKSLLKMMADHCSDETEASELRRLGSLEGRDEYEKRFVFSRMSFLDLLLAYPSCTPPIDHTLDLLPPLAPRYYSISSAPVSAPDRICIAFTLVGLCTKWLRDICVASNLLPWSCSTVLGEDSSCDLSAMVHEPLHGCSAEPGRIGPRIPVFLRRGRDFTLPRDFSRPLILIGPGTGVAPFVGFLEQRRHDVRCAHRGGAGLGSWRGVDLAHNDDDDDLNSADIDAGPAVLFFGCRHLEKDFIYRKELESFAEDGTLTKLFTAFSRDQAERIYVQCLMRENSTLLYRWIAEENGYVFVCGDGASMAKSVFSTFVDILKAGGMEQLQSESYLSTMLRNRRYVQDIWS